MIVAIEEGLEGLAPALEAAGHQTVSLYACSGAVDAVVYQKADMMQFAPSAQNFSGEGRGILMVCARHMTAEQVLKVLESKSYGALF